MASLAQLIGKRPAKYSFGEGLGAAMQEGGKYFGELAVQQRNAAALKEARDYDEKRVDDERTYNEGRVGEAREYAEGQHAEQVEREDSLLKAEREREDARLAVTDKAGNTTESLMHEDGTVHLFRVDKNGNKIEDLGPDPDYRVNDEGQVVKLSAGGTGASPTKRTEAQIKYGIHERNLNSGLRIMEGVLGKGYNLESFGAFTDQIASKFGDIGNWAASPEGRAYRTGVVRASEALFKGESGAAGSDNEAARYQSMFPAPGDDPTVVELKFMLLDESRKAFAEASGLSRNVTVEYTRSVADSVALEHGFVISDEGFVPLKNYTGSTPKNTHGLSQEDLDYLYK